MTREYGPGAEERIAAARKAARAAAVSRVDYHIRMVRGAVKTWRDRENAVYDALIAAGVDADEARRQASYPNLTPERYQDMLRRYEEAYGP
jgi:hypothetical protein